MTTEKRSNGAYSITLKCVRYIGKKGGGSGAPHFIIVAIIRNDVHSVDDVGMLQSGANAKLCGNLFLILLFALTSALWTKLLDSIDSASTFTACLNESHGAASTASKYTAPFTILF